MWSESVIVCGPNLCRFVSFVYIYCVTIAYEILVVHKIASSTVFLTGCSFIIKVKKFVTHELLPGTNHPRAELKRGPSWPWSYGSWIYNLCNRCISPVMLWVQLLFRARYTTLCDKVCQWLVTGRWFSPGPPVSSTNKTDHHDITEILLKVALNTIKPNQTKLFKFYP